MTDAERIAELEEALRQRDARIAELVRMVGRLSKVIEAWKRGHRDRSGGKIAQKPIDKRAPRVAADCASSRALPEEERLSGCTGRGCPGWMAGPS